ncbi:hypothetical protein [Pseudophaeobacter leonis]|nr:hypothetical protein [Pseudophaeobacter leonis]
MLDTPTCIKFQQQTCAAALMLRKFEISRHGRGKYIVLWEAMGKKKAEH